MMFAEQLTSTSRRPILCGCPSLALRFCLGYIAYVRCLGDSCASVTCISIEVKLNISVLVCLQMVCRARATARSAKPSLNQTTLSQRPANRKVPLSLIHLSSLLLSFPTSPPFLLLTLTATISIATLGYCSAVFSFKSAVAQSLHYVVPENYSRIDNLKNIRFLIESPDAINPNIRLHP
ncbi:hypothetical protein FN846DRAFT_53144 [Sphaerosporella brunnea]|uniref:Uncharacterized protein n=1 Tax=Sphaerosporella brunnea TaxID=1250544 RepID=A0A5J5EUP2_9PEZI|nr:hypothetical protein FN846DRAFT_53144 [Sphaerosporella brunnea]